MPPSTHSSQDQSQFEILSDEDIELLWQIILAAQRSPTADKLPFRALFQAYDTILSQNGLDPNYDQLYLRFLFRLGSKKNRGQTLSEVFKTFLAELGILVEVDGQRDGIEGGSFSRAESPFDEDEGTTERFAGRPRTRRASYSSVVGAEEETTKLGRQRDVSRASMSRVVSQAERARMRRPTALTFPKSPAKVTQKGQPLGNTSIKSRSRKLTPPGYPSPLHATRAGSDSRAGFPGLSEADYRRRRPNLARASSESLIAGDLKSQGSPPTGDDISSVLSEAHPLYNISEPQDLPHNPPNTEVIQHAEGVRGLGTHIQVREPYPTRHNSAEALDRELGRLEIIAVAYDRTTLLRQSFELWQEKLTIKRKVMEMKRLYAQMDEKAVERRSLYLLSKAFTHWAQSASEHVQQTSEARQHIIRHRYFNAWREITVVNELKVRRFRLKKLMSGWKQRYVASFHAESKAIIFYRGNLAKQIYWQWFWAYCNERAPVWRAQQLRKKYFDRWRQIRTVSFERYDFAIQTQRLSSRKSIFTIWKEKNHILATLATQTEFLYRQNLLARTYRQWRSGLAYEPRARQISSMVDWRIAATTFALIRKRATLERQAMLVNRMRILRNAWTFWNDRLRRQALGQLIDERVVLQALYIWVLKDRYKLLFRLTQKRLVQRCLRKLHSHHQAILAQRESAAVQVQAFLNRNLLSFAFQYWQVQTQGILQMQQLALDFSRPRATSKALSLLNARYQETQRLETTATYTNFYTYASRTIRQWQAAIVVRQREIADRQREKRRDVYAHIRRKVKINLVRQGLLHWRARLVQTGQFQVQADEFQERSRIANATNLFTHWMIRTQSILYTQTQLEQQVNERLVSNVLQTLQQGLAERRTIDETARVWVDLRVSKLAYDSLRVMYLKVLDLRSRREAAGSIREWNQKRAAKRIFGMWAERTTRKRTTTEEEGDAAEHLSESVATEPKSLSTYTYRASRLNTRLGASTSSPGRLQSTTPFPSQGPTAFDIDDDIALPDLDNTMLRQEARLRATVPAYLGTPSKRASRTRALVERAGSTTPAGTPGTRGLFRTATLPGTGSESGRRGDGAREEEDLRITLGRSFVGRRP